MLKTYKIKGDASEKGTQGTQGTAPVGNQTRDNKNGFNVESIKDIPLKEKERPSDLQEIRLNGNKLMMAMIYSEILGKPKCKRRGRCR